jgi:hypothetical protein
MLKAKATKSNRPRTVLASAGRAVADFVATRSNPALTVH